MITQRFLNIKEAIDAKANISGKLQALRGEGAVGEPDFMYGSIRETPTDQETIVGLQHKFLFLLKLLQSSDEKVSDAAKKGVEQLTVSLAGVKTRWDKLK